MAIQAGVTAATRMLKRRLKDRNLPSVEIPQVEQPELARTLQGIQEHLRMYEGDSGAPKERFVTIAELEQAGLIQADTKSGFSYISRILQKDVAQEAGSTANPTLKDPVKRDTSRQSRTPSGGGGSAQTAQQSTATTSKLNDLGDLNVAKPAQFQALIYDGGKWTGIPLFSRQNSWNARQKFNKPLSLIELAATPELAPGRGLIYVKDDQVPYFLDSAGVETSLLGGGGASVPDGTVDGQILIWDETTDQAWEASTNFTFVETGGGGTGHWYIEYEGDPVLHYQASDGGVLYVEQPVLRLQDNHRLDVWPVGSARPYIRGLDTDGPWINFSAESISSMVDTGALFDMPINIRSSLTNPSSPLGQALFAKHESGFQSALLQTQGSAIAHPVTNYLQLVYGFSTTTTAADPTENRMRLNNGTFASVTEMYVADLDYTENDSGWFWGMVSVGDVITLHQDHDVTRWVRFEVDAITDNTGWWTIDVTEIDSAGPGSFNNLAAININWFPAQAGAPVGTFDGQIQVYDDTVDNAWESSFHFAITEDASNIYFWSNANTTPVEFMRLGTSDGGVLFCWKNSFRIQGGKLDMWSTGGSDRGTISGESNPAWLTFSNDSGTAAWNNTGAYFTYPISIMAQSIGPTTVLGDTSRFWSYQYNTGAAPVMMTQDMENDTSMPVGAPRDGIWSFHSPTAAADPGTRLMRHNNASFASVTEMYFDDEDASSTDAGWWFARLAVGDILECTQGADRGRWADFRVDSITDNTGWWTLEVTYLDSAGTTFLNAYECRMAVTRAASGTNVVAGTVEDQTLRWDVSNDQYEPHANILLGPLGGGQIAVTSNGGHNSLPESVLKINGLGQSEVWIFGATSSAPDNFGLVWNKVPSGSGEYARFEWDLFGTTGLPLSFGAAGSVAFDDANNYFYKQALYFLEKAAHWGTSAGYGELWVKTGTPNTLWFTDDANTDFQLGVGLTIPIDLADNEEIRFGDAQDVVMKWDATQFRISGAANNQNFDLIDGMNLRLYDETESAHLRLEYSAGIGVIDGVSGGVDIRHDGTGVLRTQAAGNVLSRALVMDGNGSFQYVGFNEMPILEQDTAYTFTKNYAGYIIHKDAGGTLSFTCDEDSNIGAGATWVVFNDDTEDLTIAEGAGVTILWLAAGAAPAAGDVVVEQGGIVTVYKYTDTEYWAWGSKAVGSSIPSQITVADESADTSCFPLFVTAATGDLAPKTGTNLTFNSSTGDLSATLIAGITAANLVDKTATEAISGFWNFDTDTGAVPLRLSRDGGSTQLIDIFVDDSYVNFDYYQDEVGAGSHGYRFDIISGVTTNKTYDFQVAGVSKLLINGITNVLTASNLDADFDAITGTSFGGIASAQLVAKNATETISGTWTHTGNINIDDGTDAIAISASSGTVLFQPTGGMTLLDINLNTRINKITMQGDIVLGDGDEVTFGAGVDGTIYSDGTDMYFDAVADIRLRVTSTENAIAAVTNGAVSLYHNGGLEFRTQQHEAGSVTSGAEVFDHAGTMRDVGFNHVKEVAVTASVTLSNLHAGVMMRKSDSGTWIITLASSSTEFPIGSMCTVLNHGTGGSLTISDGSEAMYVMDGSGTVSDNTGFVLAVAGALTIWRQGASAYYIWGAGIP